MQLLELRLHPFGGTGDRAISFGNGVTVVLGPNEAGKSTLREALCHALFTPTNLTPAREQKVIGPWLPLPVGDHCRVSLTVEVDGKVARVMKMWGAGKSSSFTADGSSIADPVSVQAALGQLLRLNEATWRSVLFTPQAELAKSIESLSTNCNALDDLQSLASGSAGIPGDMSPERLIPRLQAAVEKAFDHWDVQSSRPEGGRGVSNPWKQKVGSVLDAYYARERKRIQLEEVQTHEREVDRVNAELSEIEVAISSESEFVRQGRSLRIGIAQRGELEQLLLSLERDTKELAAVAQEWPVLVAKAAHVQQELGRLESEGVALGEEIRIARQRKESEQLVQQHAQMRKALEELVRGRAELSLLVLPDDDQLSELRSTERIITELNIQMAAQSLAASIDVSRSMSVEVERGALPSESVHLEPGTSWTGDAEGRIVLRTDSMTVSVRIANGEIEEQLHELAAARSRKDELLAALQAESLAHAEQMSELHRRKQESVNGSQRLYDASLSGRSPEEWDEQMKSLERLPGTRDIDVLDKERQLRTERVAAVNHEALQSQTTIESWIKQFENTDSLWNRVMTKRGELMAVGKQLSELPQLPSGFASSTDYLHALAEAESRYESVSKRLSSLRERRAELNGKSFAATAEELQVELEHAERDFQRAISSGEAYRRILAKAQALVAEATDNPLAAYQERLASAFAFLTRSRYDAVQLNGSVPDRVSGPTVAIEPDRLSRGAIGSLALATRMAMAEIYLGEMKGFAIMDDPLTDMDPDRRAAAIEFMSEFARTRQLIVLTCHANHAEEFAAAGATIVRIG